MHVRVVERYPPGFQFREFLEDHYHALVYCLRSLGHSTHFSCNPDLEVVLGAHLLDGTADLTGRVAVNTERIGRYVHGDRERYIGTLRTARAVWSLYEDDTMFLKELGLPALTWQYGPDVFPTLVPRDPQPFLLHLGSVSPYRAGILSRIATDGHTVIAPFKVGFHEKCYLAASCWAFLALAFDEAQDYFPWPRVVLARSQGACVVSDMPSSGAFGELWAHMAQTAGVVALDSRPKGAIAGQSPAMLGALLEAL